MSSSIRFAERKTPWLERFGVYYLDLFGKKDLGHHVFDLGDKELGRRVGRISLRGVVLSALIGAICVWPTVYVAVLRQGQPWYSQLAWVGGVTLISIIIEFYLLFVIALKAVHEVSELINMRGIGRKAGAAGSADGATGEAALEAKDFLENGPFGITNILSRAALELHDPELHILGIDPFKRVSKKNLLLLGLLYKVKITLTNFIAKFLLLHTVGPVIGTSLIAGGISINYIAVPVECFWNGVVLLRVIREARLRLFGFALCHHVADRLLEEAVLPRLSEQARIGCFRAIGNAVVLARNYHPNMIVLLLRFQHLLHMNKEHRYDDWGLFLKTLQKVDEKERLFLLNLFTIAVAFDGRISRIETDNMRDAYGPYYEEYRPRLLQLTEDLRNGRLNRAAALCKIDFTAG
jgi:hypothetical protein